MKAASLFTAAVVLASSCTLVRGAATVATWSSVTAGSATGSLDGVTISATTTSGSNFFGVSTTHLSGPNWQASMPLPSGSQSLITLGVNSGDSQQFDFSAGLSSVLVYIENFDSGSMANITATGATSMSLLDGSSSISYTMSTANSGVLTTSNNGFNGEGDAILKITGPLSSLRLDYTGGVGQNAVFYGFAKEMEGEDPVGAIPEPASMIVWSALLGIGMVVARRRRKK